MQESNPPRICCDLPCDSARSIVPTLRSKQAPDPRPMYITDLSHVLDKSGSIGPVKGPARAMAQFLVDVVAHASDATEHASAAPRCFKCKKSEVEATRAHDDAIVWACPACAARWVEFPTGRAASGTCATACRAAADGESDPIGATRHSCECCGGNPTASKTQST